MATLWLPFLQFEEMLTHCTVLSCSNSDYNLSRWQQEECEIHKVFHNNAGCTSSKLSAHPKCLTCVVVVFAAKQITLKDKSRSVIFRFLSWIIFWCISSINLPARGI